MPQKRSLEVAGNGTEPPNRLKCLHEPCFEATDCNWSIAVKGESKSRVSLEEVLKDLNPESLVVLIDRSWKFRVSKKGCFATAPPSC
jgi:hypothetical protein